MNVKCNPQQRLGFITTRLRYRLLAEFRLSAFFFFFITTSLPLLEQSLNVVCGSRHE